MVAQPPSTFFSPPVATTPFRSSSLVSSANKIRAPHFGFSEKVVILSRVGGWGLSSENLVCLGTNTKNQISMRKNLEKIKCSDQLLFAKLLFFHLSLGVPHWPKQLGKSPNFCQNSKLERRFSLTLGHLCPPKSPGWLVSPPHLVEIVTQLQDVQKK